MELQSLFNFLEKKVFDLKTSPPLFNFYKNFDLSVDLKNGAEIRKENLKKYLASFTFSPDIFLLGEAPGHKGCRFSGVPFTSERLLCNGETPFTGRQSSCDSYPKSEATASIFWRIMKSYHPKFIVWNCIPFHPHDPGLLRTNRTPTISEINLYSGILGSFIKIINPKKIIAVGKRAERALKHLNFDYYPIRHPSHGGSRLFEEGIKSFM